MNLTEKQREYLDELDLLYRLRFSRGLVPNPQNFNNSYVKELAQHIRDASNSLDEWDHYLYNLVKNQTNK